MVKFIAIDADGLNAVFGESEIAIVNPYCKSKNSPKQINRSADFSQIDHLDSPNLVLNSLCTSPFELKLLPVGADIIQPIVLFTEHFSSSLLSYLFIDNDCPPPRLA
ncbi:hypothetical protein G3O08_12220 [Cryomorpha ignava]|uniref:Uncharacterized protein n=1 Tax=Cryomorpha ignava TaxID=101383 RepID=A0A7K3WRG5_9FLAO|nr:hypothetical protein [Cryomorpha ignava]